MSAGLALLAALAAPASAQNAGGRASMNSAAPAATRPDLPDLGRPLQVARVVAEGHVQFLGSDDADPTCSSLAPACRDRACGGMNVSFSGVYHRGG
ncbi:hypothetical protein FV232_07160 [Methylobacterium sp. WL30]|jgi:hypothetical protein|uniref:hypothetical protein n=1 Tax=unclassified Methylobacterium TaxID=2615210 RepID=UPI0011C9B924|nr:MULTISPECIES: hypothetical protein [unclassified Methylobacterium]TXM90000.1 hypothetical protein FV223_19935 [Methylobacterium sp. WL116]TXN40977.1 hypothetical protein FV225_04255 [Methylobacterium sp. WL93]TXN51015.1 hypothetical protein FV227_09360 [Methylobacterium sp. WL119]TXN69006.1 hypothetical protein FV232_07160 [Methylobacterium sp. WL30]